MGGEMIQDRSAFAGRQFSEPEERMQDFNRRLYEQSHRTGEPEFGPEARES